MSEAENKSRNAAPDAMPPGLGTGLDRSGERRRNLSATFGQGPGKVAIIAAGAFVVVAIAMGVHGLKSPKPIEKDAGQHVDQALAPTPENEVKPISEAEAQRRNQVAAQEADDAAKKGESYQAQMNPLVTPGKNADSNGSGIASFNLPGSQPPTPPKADEKQPQVVLPATTVNVNQQPSQDMAARERSLAEAANARDQFIKDTKQSVRDQIGRLFGDSQNAGAINGQGGYSQVSYAGAAAKETATISRSDGAASAAAEAAPSAKIKPLIKTGTIWYATLDSEVNTDDGNDVFATLRSGPFTGAKLIGKVETRPNNIQIKFTMLAPQDDRPTLRITGVALREEDAKQGMASEIDHHYLSRYTALAAASLLSGAGQAYAYTPGTTILTPTSTQITATEPSNKQVAFRAAGAMGTAAAQEIQRGYNRPTTFKTPANKGFALFFAEDVMPAQ